VTLRHPEAANRSPTACRHRDRAGRSAPFPKSGGLDLLDTAVQSGADLVGGIDA
jgi:hypothetical protein